MITKESLELLKQLAESGEKIETAITKLEQLLALQNARDEVSQGIFKMSEYSQSKIQNWEYDDILGDINALVDRVQVDMANEAKENISITE